MATVSSYPLTSRVVDPASVSSRSLTDAELIASGARGASTNPNLQAQAIAINSPGRIVPGAVAGMTQGGQGIAPTQTQFQAYTAPVVANAPRMGAPLTDPISGNVSFDGGKTYSSRYNSDGSLKTGGQTGANAGSPPATNIDFGTDASGRSLKPDALLTKEEYNAKYGPAPVDEEAVREEIRRRNQQRIDAINGAYNVMIGDRQVVNEANSGATRAVNARSGTLGSDFGNANDANQRTSNQKALNAINAERAMKIDEVYRDIDQLTRDEVAAKKAEALGQSDRYSKYLADAQEKARESAKTLGASGLSFDELKQSKPGVLQTILNNTGWDEFTLAQIMNNNKKAAEKIEYQYKTIGNKIIGYGVNPKTGQIETIETTLPAEAVGNDVKVVDGELWSVSPDGKTATKIGGSTKQQDQGFTLSPGQKRYDAMGREIAAAPETRSTTTDSPTSYREWVLAGSPGTYESWLNRKNSNGVDSPASEAERRAFNFYSRAQDATRSLETVESEISKMGGAEQIRLRYAPNFLQSETGRAQQQAERQFIEAYLRKDSGAAIPDSEYENARRTYFPQVGDDAAALARKKDARAVILNGLKREAGRAYTQSYGEEAATGTNPPPSPDEMQLLRQSFPGMSDAEILKQGGFGNDLGTSLNGSSSAPLAVKNPIASKVIASATGTYDFTNYAVDPVWGNSVKKIIEKIPSNEAEIGGYIAKTKPKSPFASNPEVLVRVAKNSGIDPRLLVAIVQHESLLGTSGIARNNNNYSGMTWNGKNGLKGSPRPANEGGYYVRYPTEEAGLMALAQNINRRKIA